MVAGIERFRAHFADHGHQYVLIGGAACELIMDEVGLPFRATKDLDMVLIVEALDAAFAESFRAFIEAGGYMIRQRGEGKKVLYRFQNPARDDFPAMLELFSRAPERLDLAPGSHLTPLPVDEAAASLSAILLDESYYSFLTTMVRQAGGIPVLDEAALIPFKPRASLDLARMRDSGEQVDGKSVRKHRNDVARLLQLLAADARYELPEALADDLRGFIAQVGEDAGYDPRQFDVNMTREQVAERLIAAYRL